MFELANRLVGIYKTENVTKSLTLDPWTFLSKVKQAEEGDSRRERGVLADSTNVLIQ